VDQVDPRLLALVLTGYFVLEVSVIFYVIILAVKQLTLGGTMPRIIREGDSYTIDEDIELEAPRPFSAPPEYIQGEPWGWDKPGPVPRGWREHGRYDNGSD
jgi:hypothetical protein